MDPKQIAKALAYLAALGLVVLVASKAVGKVGNKAGAQLPGTR